MSIVAGQLRAMTRIKCEEYIVGYSLLVQAAPAGVGQVQQPEAQREAQQQRAERDNSGVVFT